MQYNLNPRYLPSILLQAFTALWSGAAVGPEGPLVFLTGGFGSFVCDRLKLQKDDMQVLVYSSIAGAFGGFFGSPVIGAVGISSRIIQTNCGRYERSGSSDS